MTLNEVMTQTADAIREKTGKTELIAPINFAEEIKSISAGGGESGGENTYEYIELTRPEGWEGDDFFGSVVTPLLSYAALSVKANYGGSIVMMSAYAIGMFIQESEPIAIAYDPNMLVYLGEMGYKKVSEVFQMFGLPELPRLTKEQFYTLE